MQSILKQKEFIKEIVKQNRKSIAAKKNNIETEMLKEN